MALLATLWLNTHLKVKVIHGVLLHLTFNLWNPASRRGPFTCWACARNVLAKQSSAVSIWYSCICASASYELDVSSNAEGWTNDAEQPANAYQSQQMLTVQSWHNSANISLSLALCRLHSSMVGTDVVGFVMQAS